MYIGLILDEIATIITGLIFKHSFSIFYRLNLFDEGVVVDCLNFKRVQSCYYGLVAKESIYSCEIWSLNATSSTCALNQRGHALLIECFEVPKNY